MKNFLQFLVIVNIDILDCRVVSSNAGIWANKKLFLAYKQTVLD